jgi:predicted HTH transcriptional regulator
MAEHGRTECVTEYSEKISELVVGLSNSEGGRILVGIDDNGSMVGLEDRIETALRCVHAMRDKGRTGFKDRMEISGSVLRQYDDVMNFIRRNVRMSSLISGTQRIDSADYPMEAVREIVLNAIIHRDYRSTGSTLVSMYDDCMEAASPGSLPEDMPENLSVLSPGRSSMYSLKENGNTSISMYLPDSFVDS